MMTDKDRISRIHSRTAEIKREKRRRINTIESAAALISCFVIIIAIAMYMPQLMEGQNTVISPYAGTASLIKSGETLGYVIMGILSFCLSVSITILLFKIRRRSERENREDDDK